MEIKVKTKYNITGRGDVYTLSLKDNNLSNKRKDLSALMGKEVTIDDKKFLIKGIESMGTWDDEDNDSVAFLVKEIVQ